MKNIFKVLWSNPDKGTWEDPDPEDLNIDNAYKTRWIWYHTILGIELAMTNTVSYTHLTLPTILLV